MRPLTFPMSQPLPADWLDLQLTELEMNRLIERNRVRNRRRTALLTRLWDEINPEGTPRATHAHMGRKG